ncbi:hypothetical protein VPH35_081964 [Triticum aestivum]
MSSSSSHATSRIQIPACVEMSTFLCPWYRAEVDWRVLHTPKNQNFPSTCAVKCFFLWVDALAKTLMNELLEEHEEWLPILPRTAVAAARAPKEETEGGARNDREVVVELRRLNQKIRKLQDQAQIPIFYYIWAFVGMVITMGVMLKLYGKA